MAPEVVSVMKESLIAQAHPSSKHPWGLRANRLVEQARAHVAEALESQNEEIVFCSGATEASNTIIKGISKSLQLPEGPHHFITSAVDHPATLEPLRFLERQGHELTILPVDHQGSLLPSQVDAAIQPNTALVSLIHGQNEVGTLQPLAEIGAICRERGVLFHVDASQSLGKVSISVRELMADFLHIAGHKVYGPKGCGALFIRKGLNLEPLLHGGGHERGIRSGTPAPFLIAGLGEACRLIKVLGLVPKAPAERLWQRLREQLGSKVRRNGHPDCRLPNVVHLTFETSHGQEILDRARVCASTGAACHSASGSPVLIALGFTAKEAAASVRLSTGRLTSEEEAEAAADRIVEAVSQDQKRSLPSQSKVSSP